MTETVDGEQIGRRRRQAVRALVLEDAVAEIIGLLGERGIESLLLKDAGTARWLYEAPRERPYGDIDLLVAPECHDRAVRALGELGFGPRWSSPQPDLNSPHHIVFVRARPFPATVELHHTLYLLPASAPAALVWQRLSAGAKAIVLAGVRVEVPSPAVACLIVALHAAQHGIRAEIPIRDLERAVARVDVETWSAAAALAEELGARPEFTLGLRLIPAGRELADRIGLTAQPVSRLVALRAMTAPDTAVGLERLAAARGTGARLRLLARELFPTPAFMRVWRPLARRGWWGLACAYAVRPFWLLAKLPHGARAWLRAQRASGR